MKRNIDLTENNIFNRNRLLEDMSLDALTIAYITGSRIPWNIKAEWIRTEDEYDLDHQKKAIIAVGNREQRAKVRVYKKMDSQNYCDCCGAKMNLYPWYLESGLCSRCNDTYDNNEKCLWRKSVEADN